MQKHSTALPFNCERFTKLQRLLVEEILPSRIVDSMRAAAPCLHTTVQNAMAMLMMNPNNRAYPVSIPEISEQLEATVRGCIIKHVIQYVELRPLLMPADFQLHEDPTTTAKRADLSIRLQKLQVAISKIDEMGSDSSGPFKANTSTKHTGSDTSMCITTSMSPEAKAEQCSKSGRLLKKHKLHGKNLKVIRHIVFVLPSLSNTCKCAVVFVAD